MYTTPRSAWTASFSSTFKTASRIRTAPVVPKSLSSQYQSQRWTATSSTPSSAPNEIELPVVSKDSPLLTQDPATMTMPQKFVRSLPNSLIPYAELMRMDKPIGTWLLYSPCTWSITMAAYTTSAPLLQTATMLGLFGAGALIMRGAGCTINDILDRNLDNKVGRTLTRPLARKAVTVPQAVGALAVQCTAGLGILLCLPSDCFWLGALSLPFIATYPLFKRFTYYPQASLSFCFTWGALLGFPAMGVWNIPAMLTLHASSFFWCMTYDTIYAHQDKKFDIAAGIKSTALKWGTKTKPILTGMTVAQIGLLVASGVFNAMGPFFFASVGVAAYRVFSMIKKVDLDDPADCWKWFLNNIFTGHVIWFGCLGDYIGRLLGFF